MNSLTQTTLRRLKKIPQIPNVWEGDRRPIGAMMNNLDPDLQKNGECIIWVDASEGVVRGMEIVRNNTGIEAMVRTLLKAIETPHSPAEAARPKKIVVRDREIQFFLRGALQNLNILVEYVPNLVLIDELWQNFEDSNEQDDDDIPSELEELLDEIALEIWELEPWLWLADHDIIKIDLNLPEIDTIYACAMGMLGKEYGIILYRSLDSLKTFRVGILNAEDDLLDANLESAFLQQDCWFLNYSAIDDDDDFDFDDDDIDLGELSTSEIQPIFGSIHPYEGMSSLRDEEEILPIYLALEALKNFVEEHQDELTLEPIPPLTHKYNLVFQSKDDSFPITVSTQPKLADELIEILDEAEDDFFDDDDDDDIFRLKNDLVPAGSITGLLFLSWDVIDTLRKKKTFYLSETKDDVFDSLPEKTEGLPVLLIQTTRPKAKIIIERLNEEGGLTGIIFNDGEDEEDDLEYEIGLLQTPENNLYIFGQFCKDDPSLYKALLKWQKKVAKTYGYCGLLIAMGASGASRHNPQVKDMIGLFQTKLIPNKELGLGTLNLHY